MGNLINALRQDVRFIEGLKACINCGTCTAICPAASVSDYDPRAVVDLVQWEDEDEIRRLLSSDTIWRCGECFSCKTRCPRGNVPASIIQSLRNLSIDTGLFKESEEGRKQRDIKRTIGDHILKYGYCVYIDEVNTSDFPEQGPVWDWLMKNRKSVLKKLGSSYGVEAAGSLRIIPESSMRDLRAIFDITGANERFKKLEDL